MNNVHVHVSYYCDTGEANDVESGLGYWSHNLSSFSYSLSIFTVSI